MKLAVMEGARPATQKAVETMLDCFGGADGGGSLVLFCALLRQLDKGAEAGNPTSVQVIEKVVLPFARLIDLANKG